MKPLVLTFLLIFCAWSSGFSQAWYLSLTKLTSTSFSTSSVQFDVSVQDNNGAAVRGLKSANFTAFAKTCNALGGACIYTPVPILTIGGVKKFAELAPGVYEIVYDSPSHSPIDALLLQVASLITLQFHGGPNPNQKAQILIQR